MADETTTTEVAEEAKAPAKKKTPVRAGTKKKADAATKAAAAAKKKKKKPVKKAGLSPKQAEAAAAKAAKEEAKKEVLKNLTPLAHEIRTRIEKAEGDEQRAINHRVSAAIRLAEVKAACEDAGIKFKDWFEDRLNTDKFKLGYEQGRKLAKAGEAGDEEAVTLAIEDMRAGDAARQRKAREKKKESSGQIGHNSGNTTATGSDGAKAPKKDKFTSAREALSELDDKAAEELVRSTAAEFGDRLIPDAEYKQWVKMKDLLPLELLNYAFGKLSDKDKKKALEALADDLGATLEFPE